MAKAKFHLERRKDKDGNDKTTNIPIRLSFYCNGKRLEYYTQERVSNINNVSFAEKKGGTFIKVKANEPEAGRINRKLDQMARAVESAYDDAIALKKKPTIEYLRGKLDEQFEGKGGYTQEKLVKDAYQEYIQYNLKEKAHATCKKVKTTETHLSNYVGNRYNKLVFDGITQKFAASVFTPLNSKPGRSTAVKDGSVGIKMFIFSRGMQKVSPRSTKSLIKTK